MRLFLAALGFVLLAAGPAQSAPPSRVYLPWVKLSPPPAYAASLEVSVTGSVGPEASQSQDRVQTVTVSVVPPASGCPKRSNVWVGWGWSYSTGAYTWEHVAMPPLGPDCTSTLAVDLAPYPPSTGRPIVLCGNVEAPDTLQAGVSEWVAFWLVD